MTKQALTALKKSIVHWDLMSKSDPKGGEPTSSCCPLCEQYIGSLCRGCPVYKKTSKIYCRGTPYKDAVRAWQHSEHSRWIEYALKELKFLKSLLPKKKLTKKQLSPKV